ncbi:hypothetical protein KDW_30250 [Dictyobacter vulcani]|uniref:Uncharacterized protein n=1 Tax=Dictyobacter vulcani TaxID=2607529 RepID=A0A5J4KM35_9CHLR|nr:hypothetical protein KDW_30250 [Dictyobacter vulcani]
MNLISTNLPLKHFYHLYYSRVHLQFPDVYIILSGKDGNDAKYYQIEDVQDVLRKAGKEYEP